jgi:lauroyl/myristoyl acyltransferase
MHQNQEDQHAAMILTTHFGGMVLLPGVFNYNKLDISSIIRFPSEEFKKLIKTKSRKIIRALGYGRLQFFEVDKQPMKELAYGFNEGVTFFSVLDEHNPFSININFLGKTITGGAGIDKIIESVGSQEVKLYFAAMPRVGDSYKLDIHRINVNSSDYIQQMFTIHEAYVKENFEQWFFLQEVQNNIVK